MSVLGFRETITTLVDSDVDEAYSGVASNDRILGRLYYYKQYEKASRDLYEDLRSMVEVPSPSDKREFRNDGAFTASSQLRLGVKRIDPTLILGELADLLCRIQELEGRDISRNEAVHKAVEITEGCTLYSKQNTVLFVEPAPTAEEQAA
jgi:hypothetical protein